MFRKVSLILFLAIALGAFLVLRPYIFSHKEEPTIQDRLPDADFLGRARLTNLAKDISGLLYYYKVSYREFLSEEFILSQAKAYGMQIQKPSFIFANQDGSWGMMVELNDSSKVISGISKLKHLFPSRDTLIANHKVLYFEKAEGYVHYGSKYILFYQGTNANKVIKRVANAEFNQISPNWRNFLNKKAYLGQSLAIYSTWDKLKEATISEAIAYPVIDSSTVSLHTCLRSKDTLPVALKPSGINFKTGEFTNRLANVHLDHTRLKNNPSHPFYEYLVNQGRKIGFPTVQFLETWTGDLCFSQGGLFKGQEKYIESELDEDFNVTEVEKTREIKVPGFALLYTTNSNGLSFFNRLLNKGVLTEQEDGYHFLLSPALKLKKTKSQQLFYSSHLPPKTKMDSVSHINWTRQGTEYSFVIDSIRTFDFFGKLSFKMDKLLKSKDLVQ